MHSARRNDVLLSILVSTTAWPFAFTYIIMFFVT
jgi:hypothetical protein